MERGERKQWRIHFNQLIARPIPTSAYPSLCEQMYDDGLICILDIEGYIWYSGRYEVAPKVVREMWGITKSQYRRFIAWVLETDAFSDMEMIDDE